MSEPAYDLVIDCSAGPEAEPVLVEIDPADVPAPITPAEVAMHKVEKAALLMPWPGFDSLAAAIEDGISQLPAPKNALAMIEWKRAPNLQREGLTTLAVMDLIGMTAEQRDDLLNFADSLP